MKALELLSDRDEGGSMFGRRGLYETDELIGWTNGLRIERIFGIRSFYALSHDREAMSLPEWYDAMLKLELMAGEMDEYKGSAFFSHIILRK